MARVTWLSLLPLMASLVPWEPVGHGHRESGSGRPGATHGLSCVRIAVTSAGLGAQAFIPDPDGC